MGKKLLVFVYNSDSGLMNEMKDYLHKIISPSTYGCNLCALTYSNTGMESDWKSFIEDLGLPVRFLYKDEFRQTYGRMEASFPCAFIDEDGILSLLITSDETNQQTTLEELKKLVKKKVEAVDT